ncbi:DUF4397 domain-containing protein [Bacillus solitudinis]|uniref:DUF4397 domain-containing protein n=1 Tax=Bacillus solitudinis TaxID=2014074 RepID=UPI0012FDAAC0|nr:DUF4397 domain-containing protein [Bacillus solitudinis]
MKLITKFLICCLVFSAFAGSGYAKEAESDSLVRFVHASPDAPHIDIYANDELILEAFSYSDVSEYFRVPAGTHTIEFHSEETDTTVILEEITVEENTHYTLAAIGELEEITLTSMVDDKDTREDMTKIRLAHFSTDASALELATPIGNELFQEVIYSQITDYMELDKGIHHFELHLAGSDDAVVDLYDLELKEGSVYTAIAIGLVEGDPEFEVILLTDSMPMPDNIPKTGLGGASPLQ